MRKIKPSVPRAVEQALPPPAARVRPGRFFLVFLLCVFAGFGALLAPFARPLVAQFSTGLVRTSTALISAAGGKVSAQGTFMSAPSSGFTIQMKDGCNGAHVTILLWSAVLAFPASFLWKAKGLLIGTVAIQGLNFVRFISLFYLGQYNYAWFEFAHFYLWESLIMLDALVVFWLWAAMVFRSVSRQNEAV